VSGAGGSGWSRREGAGGSALVVLDMLNPYEHEDAETLARSAAGVVPVLHSLLERARQERVMSAYVNDNHGDWSAGRGELLKRALAGAHPELIEPIAPAADAAFLSKARHSGFYETQLEYMLRHEGVERIILTGQVTEQCVLYSALDAYVRHFSIVVVRDAVAHIDTALATAALRMMQRNMGAEVVDAAALFR
jgi:nicotinamidase-related amidase